MRVVYSFPDTLGKSGIGTTAFQQVRGLINEGLEVHVFCTSVRADCDLSGAASVTQTLMLRGRRIPHRALTVDGSYRYHDYRVANALRMMRGIAVVHTWPRAALQTLRSARDVGAVGLREVPNTHTAHAFEVVAEEHDRLGLPRSTAGSHVFDEGVLKREEKEYGAAAILLVPSEYSRDTFLARGIPAERLELHDYGFDPHRFRPIEGKREDGPLRVIFAGRGEPRKGLHYALEAWSASGAGREGRFTICGDLTSAYASRIKDLLAAPGVEHVGFVDEIASVMKASDAIVLPSVEEGSALVIYEAQACGAVPLVSEAVGARCRHSVDGLIHEVRDVKTLTHHMAQLARNPRLLENLRKATLARRESLTWTAAARGLRETYERQVGEARRPA